MGYTIYFSQKRPFTMQEWGDIRAAAITMFTRLKQVKGGSGEGRPLVDNSDIIFNGDRSKGEDHETFQLMKNGDGFNFCKTARKPYDRYVKAILVVANYYAPGALEVSCDGDDEPGCWDEGVRIAHLYTNQQGSGRSPCSPLVLKQIKNATRKTVDEVLAELKEAMGDAPKAPTHCAKCGVERGVAIPAKCLHTKSDEITDIDEAITLMGRRYAGSEVHQFLLNYLKANINDVKEIWEDEKEAHQG